MDDTMSAYFERLETALAALSRPAVVQVGQTLYRAYRNQKQVFTLGNGGSSATSSHMAADLVKNTIQPNMRRFRVVSLNDNAATMTALANDIGYEYVFSEQLVNAIGAGDVLLVLSASGDSFNVLNAMRYARAQSAEVVALLGFDGGEALALADVAVVVPSDDYGVIEDIHLIINHVLVDFFTHHLPDKHPALV